MVYNGSLSLLNEVYQRQFGVYGILAQTESSVKTQVKTRQIPLKNMLFQGYQGIFVHSFTFPGFKG